VSLELPHVSLNLPYEAQRQFQEEYLETRAARGTRRKFAAALSKVADVEPLASDRLIEGNARKVRKKAS
jgi:hypothetical protein